MDCGGRMRWFVRISMATAALIAAWLGAVAPARAATLVENGVSRCIVVIGEKAAPPERRAAEELSRYLGKVTGGRVDRSHAPQPGLYAIHLGTPESSSAVEGQGMLKEVWALAEDGFLWLAREDGLLIAARTPRGVLYGVYAFLEDRLGMRWYFPGEDGEYCPKRPTFTLEAFKEVRNPAFARRTMSFGASAVTAKTLDSWDWIVRNRMSFQVSKHVFKMYRGELEQRGAEIALGGHALMTMVPDALLDTHPEYFALINGKRVKQQDEKGHHLSQPCTTHPEVIDRIAAGILGALEEEPAGGSYRFLNNDCGGWCQCDRCRAIDPPGEIGRSGGSVSTRFYTLKNEVARRIFQQMPQADIWGFAYQAYRLAPLGVTPDPRLGVVLCDHGRCYRHALSDLRCEVNQWFREMFEGWAKLPNRRGYFSYYNCFAGGGAILAAPLEYVVAEDLRYMHRLGHSAWDLRTMPPDGNYAHSKGLFDTPRVKEYWRANLPMHYVQAKLAWTPEADIGAILEDLNEKYYGPAGAAMGKYRAMLRRLWDETPGHLVYGSPASLVGKSMVAPGAERGLPALLDEAEESVAGQPVYARRIAKEKELLKLGWQAAYAEYRKIPAGDLAVARRSAPITVDGVLDEQDWQSCERVTGFVKPGGAKAACQTYVRMLYDEDHLYLGLEMEEPRPTGIIRHAKQRDDPRIWEDDTAEIFIDPVGDARRYVHLAVNADGVFRDSQRTMDRPTAGDPQYQSDARIAARVEKDQWTVELKVSAKSLGATIRDGGRWKMDLGRVRRAGDAPESSTWTDGVFHQPDSFRSISFSQPILRDGGFEDIVILDTEALLKRHGSSKWTYGNRPPAVSRHWGLNAEGALTVLDEGAASGKHALQVESRDGALMQRLNIAMNPGRKLRISFAARGEGKVRVNLYHYDLADPATGRLRHAGTTRAGEVEATPEWTNHELAYTLPAEHSGRVAVLALHIILGKAALDNVSVLPVD